jgi:hypothetical protein
LSPGSQLVHLVEEFTGTAEPDGGRGRQAVEDQAFDGVESWQSGRRSTEIL